MEITCSQIATLLCTSFEWDYPQIDLNCSVPPNPSQFGYLKVHSTEKKAHSALSESLDAFMLLFAYVSFLIAMCRVPSDPAPTSLLTSTHSKWLQDLSAGNNIHPEWLQLLADSPIPDLLLHSVLAQLSMSPDVHGLNWSLVC